MRDKEGNVLTETHNKQLETIHRRIDKANDDLEEEQHD